MVVPPFECASAKLLGASISKILGVGVLILNLNSSTFSISSSVNPARMSNKSSDQYIDIDSAVCGSEAGFGVDSWEVVEAKVMVALSLFDEERVTAYNVALLWVWNQMLASLRRNACSVVKDKRQRREDNEMLCSPPHPTYQ